MSKVYANGRLILHAGDGLIQQAPLPDVCKTPSPGGPIPVPYVNLARDGDLKEGSQTVEIAGNPMAHAGSNLGTSSGDEPGTAGGGLISSKIKGKLTWASSSVDVKVEGEGIVRFLDITLHNGNKSNTVGGNKGQVVVGYGDDSELSGNCSNCKRDITTHRTESTSRSHTLALELAGALRKQPHLGLRESKEFQDFAGYMIGVLVCKGNSKIYASMSGFLHDAFRNAVTSLPGWILCEDLKKSSVPKGEKQAFIAQTTNSKYKKHQDFTPWKLQNQTYTDFQYTNPRGDRVWSTHQPFVEGEPAAGTCAAPRLVQRALADGHVPGAMTELWYCPVISAASPQKKLTVKITEHWLDMKRMPATHFSHLQTVPSCGTCEQHLPCMLCEVDQRTCS